MHRRRHTHCALWRLGWLTAVNLRCQTPKDLHVRMLQFFSTRSKSEGKMNLAGITQGESEIKTKRKRERKPRIFVTPGAAYVAKRLWPNRQLSMQALDGII